MAQLFMHCWGGGPFQYARCARICHPAISQGMAIRRLFRLRRQSQSRVLQGLPRRAAAFCSPGNEKSVTFGVEPVLRNQYLGLPHV